MSRALLFLCAAAAGAGAGRLAEAAQPVCFDNVDCGSAFRGYGQTAWPCAYTDGSTKAVCGDTSTWTAQECCYGGREFNTYQEWADHCAGPGSEFCVASATPMPTAPTAPTTPTPTSSPTTSSPTTIDDLPVCGQDNVGCMYNPGSTSWPCAILSGDSISACGRKDTWNQRDCCVGGETFVDVIAARASCSGSAPFCVDGYSQTNSPTTPTPSSAPITSSPTTIDDLPVCGQDNVGCIYNPGSTSWPCAFLDGEISPECGRKDTWNQKDCCVGGVTYADVAAAVAACTGFNSFCVDGLTPTVSPTAAPSTSPTRSSSPTSSPTRSSSPTSSPTSSASSITVAFGSAIATLFTANWLL